jgi:predicted enzyme related to lactoylglutathione lyase
VSVPPKVGFLEIPVVDPERAAEFFRRVFSWESSFQAWSGGTHVLLDGAGGEIGCALTPVGTAGVETTTPVVHVANAELDEYLARVERAGGGVVELPRQVDDLGRFARFRDSEGNLWGLWSDADSSRQSATGQS